MLERHTGLPYGWGLWLRALPARLGIISRDKSEGIVSDLMRRPPPPPAAIAPALGFWGGLRSLLYQGWGPPLREERGQRWLAGTVSVLMHLLFVLLLVWVAVVRLPPPPLGASDSSRVQVEFIGQGTPEEEGGGPPDAAAAPAAPAPAGAPTASSASPQVRPSPEFIPPAPALSSEVPPVQEREVAEPPVAQQPVQVTETPVPTIDYVLPPPNLRRDAITAPTITPRKLSVPTREVSVVETPQLPRVDATRGIAAPQLQRPLQEVQEREVAAPLPQVRTAEVPARALPTPDLRAPMPGVREREVPAPQRAAATAGTASGSAPTAQPSAQTGSGTSTRPSPAPARGNQPAATASGPAAADRSGGWASPKRGDDWGASQRNVAGDSGANAGKQPGLFNADGSLRVPPGAGGTPPTADRGAPGGGSDQWTRDRIDQSGTWLQRPPYDYEPTTFDKFWVPNESLLAEWVRRNIREAEIPIPGTGKKIRCVISVLQLGGGCGLSDPNLNEQPASARPPPEIPVKRNPVPTDS